MHDEQLIASSPDARALLDAGVPRDEVLAGLRANRPAPAPAPAPSGTSVVLSPKESTPLIDEEGGPAKGGGAEESAPAASARRMKRQASDFARRRAKDNPQALAVFFGLVAGLAPAIACLYIYFHHGGSTASCSHPLPLWLKVNGFVLLANCLLPIFLNGERWAEGKPDGDPAFMCTACLLQTFLLGWFVTGLVWLTSTDRASCDAAIYDGTRAYFVAVGVITGVACFLCCCCGACIAAFFAYANVEQPNKQSKPPNATPRPQTERSGAV
tara:strand:- start:93 stop:902 length:810 start_codon:yes stop_codon:yes gene_type:complete